VQTQREMQIGGVVVPAGVIIFQTVVVPCVIPVGIVLPVGTVTQTVTRTVTNTVSSTLPGCTFALVPNAILGTGVTGVASVIQGASQTQTQSQSGTATATASSAFTVRVTVTGLNNLNAGHLVGTVSGDRTLITIQEHVSAEIEAFFTGLRGSLTGDALATVNAQIAVLTKIARNPAACRRLQELAASAQVNLIAALRAGTLPSNVQQALNLTDNEFATLRTISEANLRAFAALCDDDDHTVTQTVTNTVTGTVTQTVTNTVTGTVTQTVTNTATGTQTITQTATQTGTVTRTVTQTATGTANNGTIVIDITGTANASAAATTVQVQAEQQTQAVNAVTGAPIVIPAGTILFTTVVTNSPCIFR